MARRRPYRQGHLDSLCGLYAIVNAIDLLHPLDGWTADGLMCRLVEHVEKKGALGGAILGGIGAAMIWRLTKIAADYVGKEEGARVAVERPFRGHRVASTEAFLDDLDNQLTGGGVALICVAGKFELAHWTVARRVTPHTLQLHDSAGMRFLRRTSCRVGRTGAPGKVVVLPAATLVLTV